MEMHQLRYVVAVARMGNFSRGAEQCHVSQPSLSQQIQKLEEELGERLFDRLKREARLTAHGEVFLRRAVRILEEVDAARLRSAQLETIQALVCSGVGISLIPAMAARPEREDLPKYRSLSTAPPERKIVAVWPKQRPLGRAAAEFLEVIPDRLRPKRG